MSEQLKAQAARLADHLGTKHGIKLKHSAFLEAIAAIHGARNWQSLCAAPSAGTEAFPAPTTSPAVLPPEANRFRASYLVGNHRLAETEFPLQLIAPQHSVEAAIVVRELVRQQVSQGGAVVYLTTQKSNVTYQAMVSCVATNSRNGNASLEGYGMSRIPGSQRLPISGLKSIYGAVSMREFLASVPGLPDDSRCLRGSEAATRMMQAKQLMNLVLQIFIGENWCLSPADSKKAVLNMAGQGAAPAIVRMASEPPPPGNPRSANAVDALGEYLKSHLLLRADGSITPRLTAIAESALSMLISVAAHAQSGQGLSVEVNFRALLACGERAYIQLPSLSETDGQLLQQQIFLRLTSALAEGVRAGGVPPLVIVDQPGLMDRSVDQLLAHGPSEDTSMRGISVWLQRELFDSAVSSRATSAVTAGSPTKVFATGQTALAAFNINCYLKQMGEGAGVAPTLESLPQGAVFVNPKSGATRVVNLA